MSLLPSDLARADTGLAVVRTAHITPGTPTPVLISISPDRTFTFVVKSPQTVYLIKQATGVVKGSGETGKVGGAAAGTLSLKQLYEIALIKSKDEHLGHIDLESIARSVMGTAKSMGVAVVP